MFWHSDVTNVMYISGTVTHRWVNGRPPRVPFSLHGQWDIRGHGVRTYIATLLALQPWIRRLRDSCCSNSFAYARCFFLLWNDNGNREHRLLLSLRHDIYDGGMECAIIFWDRVNNLISSHAHSVIYKLSILIIKYRAKSGPLPRVPPWFWLCSHNCWLRISMIWAICDR